MLSKNAPMLTTIESVNETLTIPAGAFDGCLKVRCEGRDGCEHGAFMGSARVRVNDTSRCCPGVGLTKSVSKETTINIFGPSRKLSIQL
jgi:hypothetical protein